MSYPTYCKTDIQKDVYTELRRLSDQSVDGSVEIHELEPFECSSGYPISQIHEVVAFFHSKGLFHSVLYESGGIPIIFSLNRY